MKALLILLVLSAAAAFAQSPFDGTWLVNSDTAQLPQKPAVYLVAQGKFRCSDCMANREIQADGHDQKVAETSYWDTVSVRVVDARTVELIAKKAGRTMFTEVDTVSPDGNTLTQVVRDTTEAETVTIETRSRRVEKGPAGSHAISGSWRVYKSNRSRNGSLIKYKCTTEGFSAETPLGEKYDAKFDGKDYPVEDDPAHTIVSVKRISPTSVEVTSKRNGKVVGISHMSVAPDGETIHVVFEDKESNTTRTFDMQKQP
jgi:hypothetical protein